MESKAVGSIAHSIPALSSSGKQTDSEDLEKQDKSCINRAFFIRHLKDKKKLPPLQGKCYTDNMKYFDKNSHLLIDDTDLDLLEGLSTDDNRVQNALSSYILSASGWRNVFAASKDEEDSSENISDEDKIIAITIARALYTYLRKPNAKILLGLDARPTGYTLGRLSAQALTSLGAQVTYIYIASAPEVMAYSNAGFDAFYYISASHNPIGHNGFKFGADGGVFPREKSDVLTDLFKELVNGPGVVEEAIRIIRSLDKEKYAKVLEAVGENKKAALAYYREFVLRTAGKDDAFRSDVGFVVDFNGSARTLSIDESFLTSLGCPFRSINNKPREVKHAIVPEGENLFFCRDELEKAYADDHRFILGYTPDNDGDRGNFVYIDESTGKADILQAQEVFALVVTIELADQKRLGKKNLAIAVNGPTSERIEAIAKCFDAKVFRAEVGEANAVNLGQKLRDDGYTVHILGEGSNGGNITEPAKVRDPLNSAMTFLKFLSDEKLYHFIMESLGGEVSKPSIKALLEILPVYTTTPAFSTLAKMQVKHKDYRRMKSEYERLLREEYPLQNLEAEGISGYEIHQTEGIVERIGEGNDFRSGECKGGLKVVFLDENREHLGFMWLRPSGTEPLLRVEVDLKGKKEALHDKLLSWQRSLIEKADDALK